MKSAILLAALLVLAFATASAAMTTLKWTPGWDIFSEHSNVKWSASTAHKLTITYNLAGANPNKLYQM